MNGSALELNNLKRA